MAASHYGALRLMGGQPNLSITAAGVFAQPRPHISRRSGMPGPKDALIMVAGPEERRGRTRRPGGRALKDHRRAAATGGLACSAASVEPVLTAATVTIRGRKAHGTTRRTRNAGMVEVQRCLLGLSRT